MCCTCNLAVDMAGVAYRGLCMHVVGKMSKDIGMGVRKGTVVSFVPTLFIAFWGFHPYYVCSFFKMFSCDLFKFFFGEGISMLLTPDTHVCYSGDNNSSISRDSYGSRSTANNCKVMWARKVVGVHSSGGTDSI